MPKGRGFLGCSQRTRHATPKGERCDRLTRALVAWLSPPLHRRRFPQALRYVDSLAHGEPERTSSQALKGGVFWRRKIKSSEVELGYFPWGDSGRAGSRCDALVASTSRRAPVLAKQARMPLRGSGGDEHGRLTRDARITSCPASAIF